MPYIPQVRRREFEPELTRLEGKVSSENKGDLTYLVYALAVHSFRGKAPSYTNISNAISCLNDAAEEIRRKYLNPYEDKKRKENGDI